MTAPFPPFPPPPAPDAPTTPVIPPGSPPPTPPPTQAFVTQPPPREPLPPAPSRPRRRRPWHRAVAGLAAIVAVLVVAYGCLSLIDVAARTTSRASRSLPAVPTVRLRLNGGSHVTIVGEERNDIRIERRIRRGIREVHARESIEGDTLVLSSNCPIFLGTLCSVDYDLRVPRGIEVVGSTSGGAIDLRDVGRVRVRSGGGSIDLDGVDGPVDVATGGGSIDGHALRSAIFIGRSGGGSIRARFATPPDRVDATSGGGSVHVYVPRSSPPFAVDVHAGGGSTLVQIATDPAATHVIDARAGGGSVTVQYLDAE